MFLIAFPVLVLFFIAGGVESGSSPETVSMNVNQSCGLSETECAFGCCPLAEATCCDNGFECCPHGDTCIPFIEICIGAVNDNGKVSLTSKKSTRVRSSVLKCPSGTTECAPDKCCPFDRAVCCPDGDHCCPHGYRCDVPHKKCIPDATNNEIGKQFHSVIGFEKPLRKVTAKSPYKSCPGGSRICPGYMSCCVLDNGDWGCCPNPSLPEIQYGQNDCCDTWLGYVCCPDFTPFCNWLGCF